MGKIWIYKGYNPETRRMKPDFEYKTPEVFSDTSPGDDYIDTTTPELLISREKQRYKEREVKGKEYANFMDARLIVLGNSIPNKDLSESVRAELDGLFNNPRFQISLGRWISAKREIQKVTPSELLDQLIQTYELPINQEALIEEISEHIELQIQELY